MAETFWLGHREVSFSNGALIELYRALTVIGEQRGLPDNSPVREVVHSLRHQLEFGVDGGRAFCLDQPTSRLPPQAHWPVIADLLAAFARELTKEVPDPSLTLISWDRELRLSWLAKICDLHEMMLDAWALDQSSNSLHLCLDEQTAAELQADRALNAYRVASSRTQRQRSDGREIPSLIDQALAAIDAAQLRGPRAWIVYDLLSEKAKLLADAGNAREAAALLREASGYAPDEELKRTTIEWAEELEL